MARSIGESRLLAELSHSKFILKWLLSTQSSGKVATIESYSQSQKCVECQRFTASGARYAATLVLVLGVAGMFFVDTTFKK